MAHEITSTDHLMLAGEKAWHGLGTLVADAPTPADALTLARLDWTVSKSGPIVGAWDDGTSMDWGGHSLIRRDDNNTVLGCVGSGFVPVQNATLAEVAEALGTTGEVRVETAGSLNGGRRVWFLLRSDSIDIGDRGDEHVPYVLLANGHDGSLALRCLPTMVRVVCANTWRAADESGRQIGYTFRHTAGVAGRIDEMKTALSLWRKQRDQQIARLNRLAEASISRDAIRELWVRVIEACDGPLPATPTTPAEQRRRDRAAESLAYMAETFDREASRFGGTALVAANAATNWIEHARGRLDGDARISSRLFGDYATMTDAAFRTAEHLV
jgi:phage/plasmid-like protein (TIGR03299 family)